MYKVIGPVVPGQPPPRIVIQPSPAQVRNDDDDDDDDDDDNDNDDNDDDDSAVGSHRADPGDAAANHLPAA